MRMKALSGLYPFYIRVGMVSHELLPGYGDAAGRSGSERQKPLARDYLFR